MHPLLENTFVHRTLYKAAFGLAMAACFAAACFASFVQFREPAVADSGKVAVEWPHSWDGVALRPVALGAVEQRFADRFPGTITRLTSDGALQVVFRQVAAPTRMLHPADDCYRGLGYRIEAQQLERDAQERLWRCFDAVLPGGARQRVCERIEDAAGRGFTDTSSWYWAALTAASPGPWTAITVARPL